MSLYHSTHNLDFNSGPMCLGSRARRFNVGTCHGLWYAKEDKYVLLVVINDEPGNGHFDDVMEWFENSCRRDKNDFVIEHVWNKRLYQHLIEKRGFIPIEGTESVIKHFDHGAKSKSSES